MSLVENMGVILFLAIVSSESSTKLTRTRITIWLTLFSNFLNSKTLPSAAGVHDVYISYLYIPIARCNPLHCRTSLPSSHLACCLMLSYAVR